MYNSRAPPRSLMDMWKTSGDPDDGGCGCSFSSEESKRFSKSLEIVSRKLKLNSCVCSYQPSEEASGVSLNGWTGDGNGAARQQLQKLKKRFPYRLTEIGPGYWSNEDIKYEFRHYSDSKKYIEQYRYKHAKGGVCRAPVEPLILGLNVPDPYKCKLYRYRFFFANEFSILYEDRILSKLREVNSTKARLSANSTNSVSGTAADSDYDSELNSNSSGSTSENENEGQQQRKRDVTGTATNLQKGPKLCPIRTTSGLSGAIKEVKFALPKVDQNQLKVSSRVIERANGKNYSMPQLEVNVPGYEYAAFPLPIQIVEDYRAVGGSKRTLGQINEDIFTIGSNRQAMFSSYVASGVKGVAPHIVSRQPRLLAEQAKSRDKQPLWKVLPREMMEYIYRLKSDQKCGQGSLIVGKTVAARKQAGVATNHRRNNHRPGRANNAEAQGKTVSRQQNNASSEGNEQPLPNSLKVGVCSFYSSSSETLADERLNVSGQAAAAATSKSPAKPDIGTTKKSTRRKRQSPKYFAPRYATPLAFDTVLSGQQYRTTEDHQDFLTKQSAIPNI